MRECSYLRRTLLVLTIALAVEMGLGELIESLPGALAEDPTECSVTVQPSDSIQAAIDGAQEGAVICLVEGTWEENIKIQKSLELHGAGHDKTVILGNFEKHPIIWIVPQEAVQTMSVKIEGLKTEVMGLREAPEPGPGTHGILIQGRSEVKIANSVITGNWEDGIRIEDGAQVSLLDSSVYRSGNGVVLRDVAAVVIRRSIVSTNESIGVVLRDSAQAMITESTIAENWTLGIRAKESTYLYISDSSLMVRAN